MNTVTQYLAHSDLQIVYGFCYYCERNHVIYYENNDTSVTTTRHTVLHLALRLVDQFVFPFLQQRGMKAPRRQGRISQVPLLITVTITQTYSTYYTPAVVVNVLHTFKPHQLYEVEDISSSML